MAEKRTTKDVVRGILFSAEMGAKGDQDAYKLSNAEKGNSGWSVGRTQIDLGQQTDRHGEFKDLLKKSGKLTDQEIGAVMADLGSTKSKSMSAELQGKVNGVLGSTDGKAMLDRWDEGQVGAMAARVDEARAAARENPRYASDPAFRNQVNSPAFAGTIAGHTNQYGNSPRLNEWLRGNEVEVNGAKVKLGDKVPDIDALADIETSSAYLKKDGNIEAQHTRWQAIVSQLERQGDITTEDADTMRGTVRDRYSTEDQRTRRKDPNQHEVEAGQNFSTIAKQRGVSVEDLQRANSDKTATKLKPGEFLRVPTAEEVEQWKQEKAQPAKKKTSELTPEDAERQGMPLAEFLKAKSDELAANGSTVPDGPQVASTSPEIDQQILAEQQAQATQTQKQNAPADPRAESLIAMASSPIDNPGKSALLKPVETLTQGEMQDMIASAQGDYRGWRSGDPLKAHTYEKVQDWHVNIYGDGAQQYDGGKPVEAPPIRPIPEQPSPHVTPQGEDLWQATARIGQKVADAGAADGFDEAVKGLQRGLNILGEANPLPARSPAYGPTTKLGPVTEDGKYGPQTDFALKHATARLGPTKVDEAFALGRFNTFARQAQRSGNVDGLEQKAHSIFGPLFRDPKDDKAPKVEGGIFQETLNGIGGRRYDDWQPLKVDNWIGPKTTTAFGRILQDEDADSVTTAFGRGLGLL